MFSLLEPCLLSIWLFLATSCFSQDVIWYSPMNSSITGEWAQTGTVTALLSPSGICPDSANGNDYCWSITTTGSLIRGPVSTEGYQNVQLIYSGKGTNINGPDRCFIEYTTDGTLTFVEQVNVWSSNSEVIDQIFPSFINGDDNTNGIAIRLRSNRDAMECYFNELRLEGNLITPQPTTNTPTTSTPTTNAPTTNIPPTTAIPTTNIPKTNYMISTYEANEISYGSNTLGALYVAYPMNVCFKDGNGDAGAFRKFQCSSSGDIVFRCTLGSSCTGSSTLCDASNRDNPNGIYDVGAGAPPVDTLYYGSCDSASASKTDSTGVNWVEVDYFTAYKNDTAGCPQDTDFTFGFTYQSTNIFATGICVEQDDGSTYLMATCSVTGGEIGVYSNSGCTVKTGTLVSFTPQCEYLYKETGANSPRWFRRFGGCVVNGIQIVVATPPPTSEPTDAPVPNPTNVPTQSPNDGPSQSPTTNEPSRIPSSTPTDEPTMEPTDDPTKEPTSSSPTTPYPTDNPVTISPTSGPTDPATPPLFSDPKNLGTTEYLIIIGIIIFLLLICFCFCRERRKAAIKKRQNDQKARDIHRKIDLLKAQNRQKREIMIAQQTARKQSGENQNIQMHAPIITKTNM